MVIYTYRYIYILLIFFYLGHAWVDVGNFVQSLICFREKFALKLKKIRCEESNSQRDWKYFLGDRDTLITTTFVEENGKDTSLTGSNIR
jgi:hypothetical protein